MYFVHSYYAAECEPSVIAYTEYGAMLTAAAARGNVYGCQFHPEKSGNVGLSILKAFCELEGGCELCAPEIGCGPNGAGGQSSCGRPESGKEVRP